MQLLLEAGIEDCMNLQPKEGSKAPSLSYINHIAHSVVAL